MALKRQRRKYEVTALVAVRKSRQLVLFWARRCRKSTTLGSIAYDEMSGNKGRTVIAASASLLLGKELVGMTVSAAEQASIVTREALAVQSVFANGAASQNLALEVANSQTGKVLEGLTESDFAELYSSSSMEMRLKFDRTTYSRLKIIAPNPATARGWGGTVLRDEAGYTPANLENELRIATKPIMDTDPTFKLIYASNLCPNDRHPFFEMTLPPPDLIFPPKAEGHFYRGQNGILIHRVALADAYAAGHVLYDDAGKPLTLEQFRALPGNRLGASINYDLNHESGGAAAVDLMALLTSQRRGAADCAFVYIEDETDWRRALDLLRVNVRGGRIGIGVDIASTTGELSNPTSITVTEAEGVARWARLIAVFKTRKRVVMAERLKDLCRVVRHRATGGPVVRICIDASNEQLAAEEIRDDLRGEVAVELVKAGASIQPAGYPEPTNYKTYQGDLYSTAINDNRYALPAAEYVKLDHRLAVKDRGRFENVVDNDGRHGDTFDSGKQAEWALMSKGGMLTTAIPVTVGSDQQSSCA